MERSLADMIVRRASSSPAGRAYTLLESGERDGDVLTWGALEDRSRRIAAEIARRVPAGARVLLLFPPGLDFIPAFFASLRAGTIAIPSYPPASVHDDRLAFRLRGIAADAGVSLVLASPIVYEKRWAISAIVPQLRALPWLNAEVAEPATIDDAERRADPDAVALLQYTSGSTAQPRGVMVTHANLLHNLACSASLAGHGPDSIAVSWLPINHDMGLIEGVLQPAFSGFPAWLMAPAAFLQRPVRWLQAISRLGATHSGGPNFAYDLCVRRIADADRAALDLRAWRTAFNGSEPVRRETLESFHAAFARCGFRRSAFRPAYGLAESTLLVASGKCGEEPAWFDADAAALRSGVVIPARDGDDRVSLVASGPPAPGMTVAIVDPARGVRSTADRVGEIWISGPSVAAGYWQRASDTATTFCARIGCTGEGPFLRTGDLGVMRDGVLYVTGRRKDVLIVRGLKHYPQDVERTAENAHPAIRSGCSAAVGIETDGTGAVAILAEVSPRYERGPQGPPDPASRDRSGADLDGAREICETLAAGIASAHGFTPAAVCLLAAGTLPRTTSGKLQRFRCRELFLSHALGTLYEWSPDRAGHDRERVAS